MPPESLWMVNADDAGEFENPEATSSRLYIPDWVINAALYLVNRSMGFCQNLMTSPKLNSLKPLMSL